MERICLNCVYYLPRTESYGNCNLYRDHVYCTFPNRVCRYFWEIVQHGDISLLVCRKHYAGFLMNHSLSGCRPMDKNAR